MSTNDADRKFGQATALYREKRYPEALQLLNQLDSDLPLTKDIMYPRALCLAALGQKGEALQVCKSLEALFQDARARDLKVRLEGDPKLAPSPGTPAQGAIRSTSISRAKSGSRLPVVGIGVVVAVIGVAAAAFFLFAYWRGVTPGNEFGDRPQRADVTGTPSQQAEIDKAMRREMASSSNSPFTTIYDTGSASPKPYTQGELTSQTGWTQVPEGETGHTFAGDAVLMNNQVAVVLRKAGSGAELCGQTTGFQKTYANLVPIGNAGAAQGMDSLTITKCEQDEVIVEVSHRASDGQPIKMRYELAMGQVIAKVTPVAGATGLRVEAPSRFAVLPDFFADDIVVDAREVLADTAELPSENFLLHMVGDGEAIVMDVWNNRDQDIRVVLDGDAFSRQIQSSEIAFGKDGSVWVALLAANGVWHMRDVKETEKGKVLPLDWQRPYPALWRVDWKRSDDLTDSWEMLTEMRDGKFKKHGLFEEEEDSWTAQDWWGSGTRTRIASGLGRFHYPCWVDRQGQGWLEPLLTESWGSYAPLEGTPNFRGPAIIYPLNRLTDTPLDKFTVVDLVRTSLGVGPCEYILDVEGQHEAFAGMPTCTVRDTLDEIYESGQQKERRADVEKALDDVVAFITLIRGRIDKYQTFSEELRDFLQKYEKKNPGLAPYIQDMVRLTDQIDSAIAKNTESIKTVKYATNLAKEFRSELLDYDGNDAAEKCKKFTEAWVEIGGNQDTLVAECRVAVRLLRQTPAVAFSDSPERADLVREVRSRTESILRAPVNYEAPRH
ncbi:MAG: hypothetical protein SGI88_13670 [Candidatus Hydrogenedentes bacterium]|nr:hypothetical protein [Candidatus Hydrogenedentota bacterium]